ncbi:MAG: HslU--HslV peptidase ATPase subunit [Ignavibacteria bacterium CG22_combo_CG10-13_8_21_14_all_37_15]|nr:ATP-dependent protease ATPase subunit HslU [Ignavibacteria bacterium]NCS81124.1 ATP-dependent protease ATPase subunit HslU [Ignavibacteria bacterium]OIO13671.1 MAG: HslU--HslV peptidase ATPase subunit [Ignavibacteria bacterium CG1_02_37_35]PIP77412.1 MAG: HslU--HslV peptidase ATPase subunit [Ignavibacteria bacterium CG22_combo_CG10-13_8_21_14_all_37_15]PJC57271.1 MAG: HslU--HslV peptidase ATPase subunit [Ignavibacteria bacterium CG_4_9_14_0_2_um_filter_37_13]
MEKILRNELTPNQIVNELNKFIIGQNEAKRAVAIALRNRWRRQQVTGILKEEIMPNNIILIGPTGVGKTEIARRLAKLSDAPFIKVEATKYTEVGYVGRDVESMIRDLTDVAVNMIKAEKTEEVKTKAEELAYERILDLLIPPVKKPVENGDENKNEVAVTGEDPLTNQKTREWMRTKLHKGEIDNRLIEFDITTSAVGMQVLGPIGGDDLGINIQEIMSTMLPKKKKKRKTTIAEAKEIFSAEEAQKLIDIDTVQKEAIERVENSGIIFIDEIDKIAGSGGRSGGGPDVSREGVQRDLLPIVEGSTVNTKYGQVRTDHILFIASGAFHASKPSDLIPEMQGRFPIRVELKSLTEDDFIKILTLPENALLKQYSALLETENVTLHFTEEGIKEIARIAFEVNEQVENIGARRLHTILTTLLDDILFEVPDKMPKAAVKIDAKLVKKKLDAIVKNRDLSKYIL